MKWLRWVTPAWSPAGRRRARRLSLERREDRTVPSGLAEIVAFGDSYVDTGNIFVASGGSFPASPPYYAGRFSNGPVWVERLAADFGLPAPTPSQAGGLNYAWGGAETGLDGLSTHGTPNIGTQIGSFLSAHPRLHANQLVVIDGGIADLLFGQTDPSVPASNLATEITTLAHAGGRYFLVSNLPPVGDLPAINGQPARDTLNVLSAQFNSLLAQQENDLERSLQITIFRLDLGGLVQNMVNAPASFGFSNVTGQALHAKMGEAGPVVPNPDEYLFWDEFHFTRVAHQIIGDAAAAAGAAGAGVDTWALVGLDVGSADLGGATHGMASGKALWLDANAADRGSFADPTTWDGRAFTTPGSQGEEKRIDRITVLEDELDHLFGLEHTAGGAMPETWAAGNHRVPSTGSDSIDVAVLDRAFADGRTSRAVLFTDGSVLQGSMGLQEQ
jgi:phospholipase/lecithinase/hemolysin